MDEGSDSGEEDGEINALTPVSSPVSHFLPLAGLTESQRQGPRCNSHRAPPRTVDAAQQRRIERDTEYSILVECRVGSCGKEAVLKFWPHFN